MPSRRSRAPLSALPRPSYSAKIRDFSAADHRRVRAFAGTSGSGTGLSELTRFELQTRPHDNVSGASPASLNLGIEGRRLAERVDLSREQLLQLAADPEAEVRTAVSVHPGLTEPDRAGIDIDVTTVDGDGHYGPRNQCEHDSHASI